MSDIRAIQKRVIDNKLRHGWNTTDINEEICHLVTEIGEAYSAIGSGDKLEIGEELADVAIYLLGIAEICDIDLGEQVLKKLEKNEGRIYFKDEKGIWHKRESDGTVK